MLAAAALVTSCTSGSQQRALSGPASVWSITSSVSSPSATTGSSSPGPTASSPSSQTSNPPVVQSSQNPLAATHFWIDPASHAALELRSRTAQGKFADAAQLRKIASRPTALWLGSWQALGQLDSVLRAAAAASATVVLVAYFIPDRDCGGSSAGGARNAADYRGWIASLAGKLGSHRAVVVLEPDAVPMSAPGGCAAGQFDSRSALLTGAVRTLKALPAVSVYLDAGHPAWPSDPQLSVGPLQASGLGAADGFALNTSNFQRTADDLRYGDALSALVGGKHFIVDTGRNGNGPLPSDTSYRGPSWCNPPGRSLGQPPTVRTGDPLTDAFVWVKYPGESDGSCGLGDLTAGSWLPDYAIGLARRSSD
ncbi:MAG: glycoside hydrolase family 6 protein [Actinomycetota bacterium]|nr:glycoside hydrolase family 6 protein [Actinomycetota bacterium]MDQ2955677.1 glycoside hydrolase family 6 protein [Actinomycetota bacterium]